jgi:hypothetical protein
MCGEAHWRNEILVPAIAAFRLGLPLLQRAAPLFLIEFAPPERSELLLRGVAVLGVERFELWCRPRLFGSWLWALLLR